MIISNFSIPDQYTVQLSMNEACDRWLVTYGLQEKVFRAPEDALTEFHHCINHAARSAGWILGG